MPGCKEMFEKDSLVYLMKDNNNDRYMPRQFVIP